jgi:hypothetical protein
MKAIRLSAAIVAVALAGLGAAAAPAGAGGKAGFGCAPAFDLGGLTLEQGLALPRVQAGLAAGVLDEAALAAAFNKVDHNEDGVLCFKDVGALNDGAGIWQYLYNIVDNNASVPGN